MNMNSAKYRGWFSRSLQAASCGLAFVVLLPAILAAQMEHEPTYRYRVLYNFCSLANCADGSVPYAGVIEDSTGSIYGTTWAGGLSDGGGVVFKVNKNGKETVLHAFAGNANPVAGLVQDSAGNLYGTTQYGGDFSCGEDKYGCGTVFKVDLAGHETVFYRFKGGTDGMFPVAGLIRDEAGNLYGTTELGGSTTNDCGATGWGCGTVFKLTQNGKETVLHRFDAGADFGVPMGGLVIDAKGNLYGTTYGNGTDNPGTVYKVTKYGKETVLYTFKNGSDSDAPMGSLLIDAKGNLYGTTTGNDEFGDGTVFKVTESGKEIILHAFEGRPDGANPYAGLIMDGKGNLYGTTRLGGIYDQGTVFKLSKNGDETVLYSFTGGSDGAAPIAVLLQDAKGNLYGTTGAGGYSNYCPYGQNECGVVFKMTPQ